MQNQFNQSQPALQSEQVDQWLSVYLFYEPPWEKFLTSAVYSFVSTVMNRRWADQFFFIRYWENGPHIRLRLKSSASDPDEHLRTLLLKHFEEYFSKHPSIRLREWEGMSANNSVAFVAYQPEVERYGGADGMVVAERQFMLSSQVALKIFSESENWTYQDGLTNAIILHTSFAHAMKMDLSTATDFFRGVYSGWLSSAERLIENNTTENKPAEQIFAESFEKQEGALVPFVNELWSGLEANEDFADEWLNLWIRETGLIYEDLRGINLHRGYPVFYSYVHMTNNRLGISNHDEGYLGFLISECLERIGKKDIHR